MLRGALPPALPPAAAPARGLREIYATHTSVDGAACVRVYQAYSAPIAARAAAANSFAAPLADGLWSGERVSWIKPSAAWMAYRCGWTLLKDAAQARVLALDLDRAAFMRLLARARVTHGEPAGGLKGAPVRVQWDPERALDPTCADEASAAGVAKGHPFLRRLERVRSLQVGVSGGAGAALCDARLVRRITDVTPAFRAAHAALARGELERARAALWPDAAMRERRVEVPPEVRAALQMDEPGRGDGSAERAREAGPRRQRRQDAPAPTEEEEKEEEEEEIDMGGGMDMFGGGEGGGGDY